MPFNNNIMRCYNLFPYMYQDIRAMTDYLSKIKEMGFNTVWLNPIQDATNQYPSTAEKNELAKYDLTRCSTYTGSVSFNAGTGDLEVETEEHIAQKSERIALEQQQKLLEEQIEKMGEEEIDTESTELIEQHEALVRKE